MKKTALLAEYLGAKKLCRSFDQNHPFRKTFNRLNDELGPMFANPEFVQVGRVMVEGGSFQFYEDGVPCFLTPVLHIDPEKWRFHVWGPIDEDGYLISWDEGFWRGDKWVPGLGIGAWTPRMAHEHLAEVIDIVAWHPARPGVWARRTGQGDMLGQITPGEPLRVHQTPLGWLRSGGEGICFLDRDPVMIASELRLAGEVIADDPAHARALRQICERPYPVPKISAA